MYTEIYTKKGWSFRQELKARQEKLFALLNAKSPDWETIVVVGKVEQYYFTGTMQDGILVMRRGDGASGMRYFVRRSFSRACDESPVPEMLLPMNSYRDMLESLPADLGVTYIDTEVATAGLLGRFGKYFCMTMKPAGTVLSALRAVKSDYELHCLRTSAKLHGILISEIAPTLINEGMSEAELNGALYYEMMKLGHHGVDRFCHYQTEMGIGQIAFGTNSLYPTNFDGPGGSVGMNAAVPVTGSDKRRLERGDIVFLDIGFGINGYHTDKTRIYVFGEEPTKEMKDKHQFCIDCIDYLSSQLRPGAIPSRIYNDFMASLDTEQKKDFMGYGDRSVKFLGHGIGLFVDESPVIAPGFDDPIEENMVFALEPKKGISGRGMVGVEETYIVTPSGGECITGGTDELTVIGI